MITLEQLQEILKEKIDNPTPLSHEIMKEYELIMRISEFEHRYWLLLDPTVKHSIVDEQYGGVSDLIINKEGYDDKEPYEVSMLVNDEKVLVPIQYEEQLKKVIEAFYNSLS